MGSSTMHVILTLAAYWIFSAAVGAMIEPTEEQRRGFYGWLFRFAQIIAANADRLAAAKFGPAVAALSAVDKPDHNATDIHADAASATDPAASANP